MRYLFFLYLIFILPVCALAQDEKREVIQNHIGKKSYTEYPDAAAIVLYEKGTVEIIPSAVRFEQRERIHEIIKILDPSAFDLGDVSIIYQNDDQYQSKPRNIIGTTYNIENGKIVKTPLDKTAIFNQKLDDAFYESKFTLPAIKAGSIIEYSYELEGELSIVAPTWRFQGKNPTLKSEYEFKCPRGFGYTYVIQSLTGFPNHNSVEECEADSIVAYKVITPMPDHSTSVLFGRKMMPPLVDEPYITSTINHEERIDLQLASYNMTGSFGYRENIINTWPKFNERMHEIYSKYYGGKNVFLKKTCDTLLANTQTDVEKAKKIFQFVRSSFLCTDTIADYTNNTIEDVYKSKNGNAAEINLLLAAMLRSAKLNASPVILSTLGNLRADSLYPLLNRFNHVVTVVEIAGEQYFLDATGKNNPFGLLPPYCYNGYARIINEKGAAVVLDSKQVKERSVNMAEMESVTDTGYSLLVSLYIGMNQSRALRQYAKNDSLKLKQFLQTMIADPQEKLSDINISYLDNPDTNLVVKFRIAKKFDKKISKLFFTLDYFKAFGSNPFVAMKRNLPVELPFRIESIYILKGTLPSNVKPEAFPGPALISFEKNELVFRHTIAYDEATNSFNVNSKFQANETIFPVAAYDYIRKFFEKMVQETNHTVVFNISGS